MAMSRSVRSFNIALVVVMAASGAWAAPQNRRPNSAPPAQAPLRLEAPPAQAPAQPPAGTPPDAAAVPVNPASYHIGAQDQLKVTVFDEPDLSSMYRVDAEGFITLP